LLLHFLPDFQSGFNGASGGVSPATTCLGADDEVVGKLKGKYVSEELKGKPVA
jgi:ABC-type sugar transport system substrate-binding protein